MSESSESSESIGHSQSTRRPGTMKLRWRRCEREREREEEREGGREREREKERGRMYRVCE